MDFSNDFIHPFEQATTYMTGLYDDCYQMYENDIKVLEVNPESVISQANPQQILENMKTKALSQVFVFDQFCQ